MGGESRIPAAVGKLVELVGEYPAGVARVDLVEASRTKYRGLPVQRLTKLLEQALAAGLIEDSGGVLRVTALQGGGQSDVRAAEAGRCRGLRAVAIDLESVVRTTFGEPYLERH